MILTGVRIKRFSPVGWSVSEGVALIKGNMPTVNYVLGLVSLLLLEISSGLGRETKA